MEMLQVFELMSVQGPCFTAIKEAVEGHSLVTLELFGKLVVVLVQDTAARAAKSLNGLAHSGAYLFVQAAVASGAGKVFEIIHRHSLNTFDGIEEGRAVEAGACWKSTSVLLRLARDQKDEMPQQNCLR